MAPLQLDKVLKVYKSLAQKPSVTSAKISWVGESGLTVQSSWSQRNLERAAVQKFTIEHTLTNKFEVVAESFPIDTSTELLSKTTEDGQHRAVLRAAPKEKDATSSKQFIEIWNKRCLLKNYDLSAFDVHGDVYTDCEFSAFEWSKDATKLIYIAEKKLPKSEPFYDQKSANKKPKEPSEGEEVIKGNEFIYKPDWGEQLVGKHHPVIAILDIEASSITVAEIPDELSPGQVTWAPDDETIVGVVTKHEPRHLGLKFCTNRPSWIFQVKKSTFVKISSDHCSARSPRFSKDGKHLVWLERDLSGPHHNAHRLMHLKWESPQEQSEQPEILIDVVRKSITISGGKLFYGVYNRGFPRNCWSNDSKVLFFSTPQRSNIKSYALDIETKCLTELSVRETNSDSLIIQSCKDNILLFLRTNLLMPPQILIGQFESQRPHMIVESPITQPSPIDSENLLYETTEYVYDTDEEVREFNFTYLGPKNSTESHPLILMAHGGPHSAYANMFMFECALLAQLGFGLVLVNYRGSIGMGTDNVEYLQGRVGNADVLDCVTATREALKKYPWLDSKRVGLSGGSHGGFLVTHLSGQYSDMYKAVVTRNPVIDIASMFTISDIPDCRNALFKDGQSSIVRDQLCLVEAQLAPHSIDTPIAHNEQLVLKMFRCSPIVHVDKVTAPTLICLGKNDLRVPHFQGKHWYHQLKAKGVKTKMLIYDDNHQLGSGTVEIDHAINATLWMMEHLNVN